MKRRLYVFDMDGTLLPGTTACFELAKATGTGRTLEALEADYASGRVDGRRFARVVAALWDGMHAQTVREAFAAAPKLRNIRAATRAIARAGGVSGLITLAPDFFANHFYAFGFDHVFASRLPGKVLTPQDKPRLAEELCAYESLDFADTVAFGDSISDYPLFRRLRHTVGVNPDVRLAEVAAATYRGDDLRAALEASRVHAEF